MEDAGALSISVSPDDANDVLLAVSGRLESGGGGVYHSADGGGHWVWASDGLPHGEEFFRRHIYDMGGCELAQAPGGAAVALNMAGRHVFRRRAPGAPWERSVVEFPGSSIPAAVTANEAGHFFLAVHGEGILRSTDGGANWTRVRAGSAATIAADPFRPGRLAAGTEDGLIVSGDGGATWRPADGSMPNRHRVLAGFAPGRLIAGTHGNGVFWMPLE
jgi:photosystem II stability/assembly factor-like uncharacterized protein